MSFPCPQPETLRSYLSGKSTDLETEIFEAHFVSCIRCQTELEILSEESDSMTLLVASTVKAPQMAGVEVGNSRSSFGGFLVSTKGKFCEQKQRFGHPE
jgi:hypothetical protein